MDKNNKVFFSPNQNKKDNINFYSDDYEVLDSVHEEFSWKSIKLSEVKHIIMLFIFFLKKKKANRKLRVLSSKQCSNFQNNKRRIRKERKFKSYSSGKEKSTNLFN